ncbi:hypothetical protein FGB62_17g00 [Gracilaria domingensis]|nr:hypothetical protein FGB62_17g00 [Gracilaria domingensis]
MAAEKETSSYVEITLPENVRFSLEKIWVPENAHLVAVNEEVKSFQSDHETTEIVHTLSEKHGNVAKVLKSSVSASIRKALWREQGDNRQKENARSRERYKRGALSESAEEKKIRLAKRRARYA